MIQEQVLFINDEPVTSFTEEVNVGDNIRILLPNKKKREQHIDKLPFSPPKVVLFNKPKWCVVSKDDPHNKTIFDILPERWRDELWYIWRLDKNSTWLLLLTNDTSLVDRYENPKNNVHKVYKLEIDKPLRSKDKAKMKKWVEATTQWYSPDEDPDNPSELLSCVTVSYAKTSKEKHEVIITLNEWKKRQLRRIMRVLWYKIYKLHRLKVGKRDLGDLKVGKRRIEKIKRAPKWKKKK